MSCLALPMFMAYFLIGTSSTVDSFGKNFAQVGFVPRIFFFVEGHILVEVFWSSEQDSAKMSPSINPEIYYFGSCRRFFVIGEAGFLSQNFFSKILRSNIWTLFIHSVNSPSVNY